MAEWKQDVVRITYDRPDRVGVATGYALSSTLVLTARHVAFGADGKVRGNIRARLCWQEPGKEVAAGLAWPDGAPAGVDLALLRLHGDLPTTKRPLLLSARVVDRRRDWASRGFPSIVEPEKADPDRDHQEPQGQTAPCTPRDQRLTLDVTTQTMYWHGLSGAPVVAGDSIVAVVKSFDPDYQGALYATPLHVVRDDDSFWRHVGLVSASHASDLEEEVLALERRVATILKPHAATLVARLAARLQTGPTVDEVAQTLVRQTPASQIGRHLDHLDDDLSQEADATLQRTAIRDLLSLVLPYAVDLRAEAVKVRTALTRGATVIRLPYTELTVLEAVMAGVRGDPASWVADSPTPGSATPAIRGTGAIRLPPTLLVPTTDPAGTLVRDDVAKQLAFRVGLQVANVTDRLDDLRIRIEAMAENPRRTRRRYHIVFVDREQPDAPEVRWEIAARGVGGLGLGASVPLVRLVGPATPEEERAHQSIVGVLDVQGVRKEP